MPKPIYIFLIVAAVLGSSISFSGVYLFHLALATMLVSGFTLKLSLPKLSFIATPNNFIWIAPFLLIWFVISLIWAQNISSGLKFIAQLSMGLAVSISVVHFSSSEEHQRLITKWLAWLLGVTLLLALIEIATPFRWPISYYSELSKIFKYHVYLGNGDLEKAYLQITPTAFFWNPNNLALVLIMAYPIVFSSSRKLFFFFTLLVIVVVFFSGSRLAFVVLLMQQIALIFTLGKDRRIKSIASTGLIVLCLSLPIMLTSLEKQNYTAVAIKQKALEITGVVEDVKDGLPNTSKPERSSAVRGKLIVRGTEYFINSKGLGVGAGNSSVYLKRDGGVGNNKIVNLHNIWLEFLVDGGVVVGIALLIWFALLLKKWNKCWRLTSNGEERHRLIVLIISIVGAGGAAMGPSSCIYFLPFFVYWGWVIAQLNTIESKLTKIS